ncbi:MAG: hypothetical protein E7318_10425 [Clostridiales bacterium]|nr:hypothetical protein [Clostridiales bacterium]
MKRMMRLLCLLMMLVLLPVTEGAAYVVDENTFNKTCKWRMTRTSTLYLMQPWHVDGEVVYTFEPIGTLANAKCIRLMQTKDDKAMVTFWSGGEKTGWIDKGTYTSNSLTIYSTSGEKTSIPGMAWRDETAVRYNLLTYGYSEDQIQGFLDGMRQGLRGERNENGEIVIVKEEPLTPPVITMKVEEADKEVEMVLPGMVNSTVRLEGEELTVPTSSLIWDAGEAENPLARIYAPKNGVASVYARDEGKGGVIKKFKTGSIVLVLGKSEKYTKVFAEGTVGYVITSALEMYDVCEDAQEIAVAHKAYLRLVARESGHRLAELSEGTVVYLIDETKQWAQVEYQGFVGYVEVNRLEK